jgi:membrane protein
MQISLHSAYTSFFLILSLFPFLLLFLGVLKYTTLEIADLMRIVEGWLPQNLLPIAGTLIEISYRHSSGAVVSISLLAALYSASRGMFGLRNGLNAVYPSSGKPGFLRRRSLSALYTLVSLLLLVLTLGAYLLGTAALDYLCMTTAPVVLTLVRLVDWKWLLLAFLQSLQFAFMYAWLPDQRNRLRQCWPGAVAASLGWLAYSGLFSMYMDHFSDYTNIYGSIYALALGMLWLYFCIMIFFYGGALNRYLRQRRGS